MEGNVICFCCTCFLEKVTLNLEFEELGVDFGWGLGWLEGQGFGKLTQQFPIPGGTVLGVT